MSKVDKLVIPALIAAAVLTTAGFLLAFLWTGPVNGAEVSGVEIIGGQMVTTKLLLSQKIFYFHMAVAVTSMVLMIFMCYNAVRFLMTKDQAYDTRSWVLMQISLIFVLCTMATGVMWTKFEWGAWWVWEPRLTSYLVLMLICIGYFILRSAIDEPERRATYAAVVGIICFIDVPICYAVTRIIPSSLHPVVLRQGGMSADMAITVAVCTLGFLALGFVFYRLRLRAQLIDERTEALLEQLDEE